MSREIGQAKTGRVPDFREADVKICELCGGLNLVSNPECFVCGWHGRFERDAHVVHAAIEIVIRRHGRLELQHLTDAQSAPVHRQLPLRERIVGWVIRFSRHLRR